MFILWLNHTNRAYISQTKIYFDLTYLFNQVCLIGYVNGYVGLIDCVLLYGAALIAVGPGLLHGNLNFARQFRCFTQQF